LAIEEDLFFLMIQALAWMNKKLFGQNMALKQFDHRGEYELWRAQGLNRYESILGI